MREDLAIIVSSLINNIGGAKVSTGARYGTSNNLAEMRTVGQAVADGLEVLDDAWPGLEASERRELGAVVKSLRRIYKSQNNNE